MSEPLSRNGWTRVAFGDVARLSRERSTDPEADGFERYVGLEHIEPGDLTIRRWGEIADGTTFTSVFRPGQVLFGKRRAYQRKVAVADFAGVCSGDIYVLEPKSAGLLPELLPFVCQTDGFFEHAVGTSAGSLSPRTRWDSLASYKLALPPLGEQERIASLLHASSHILGALRELRAKTSLLLASAVEDLAMRAIEAGAVVPLNDLVEKDRPITYGILMPGQDFPGGVPVIKVKDFPDGRILEETLLRTDPRIDEEYRRSRLREGDLLISIRGTVGRLAFVPGSLAGANITQDTARLSLAKEHDASFVRAMLGSRFVQRQIAGFVTGLAVKGINLGELRQVRVPIADFDQQVALSREVGEIRVSIDRCDVRFAEAKKLHGEFLRKLTELPQ